MSCPIMLSMLLVCSLIACFYYALPIRRPTAARPARFITVAGIAAPVLSAFTDGSFGRHLVIVQGTRYSLRVRVKHRVATSWVPMITIAVLALPVIIGGLYFLGSLLRAIPVPLSCARGLLMIVCTALATRRWIYGDIATGSDEFGPSSTLIDCDTCNRKLVLKSPDHTLWALDVNGSFTVARILDALAIKYNAPYVRHLRISLSSRWRLLESGERVHDLNLDIHSKLTLHVPILGGAPVRNSTTIRETREAHNPTGKNQWGGSWLQREPQLPQWIQDYLDLGVPQKKMVAKIKNRLNGSGPCLRTIEGIIRQCDLTTSRNHKLTDEEAGAHILKAIETDNLRRTGYRKIHEALQRSGVHMPRDFVEFFLRQIEPEKVDERYATATKKVHTAKLTCEGPNAEWSCDGHDKLIPEMNISIWGVVDKYARRIMRYFVVPSYKRSDIAAALYLRVAKERKGIPFQLSLDKGSETNHAAAVQIVLRMHYAPEYDIDVYPAYRGLKSIYNISVEKEWKPLYQTCLENILVAWLNGKHAGIFHPENEIHQQIARWVWGRTTQLEVDRYVAQHNAHKIRRQTNILLPSGGSPDDFFDNPHEWGGRDCLVPVDENVLDDLIIDLTPPDLFQWASPEVESHCARVYEELGCPAPELPIAWNIVHAMILKWTD